jgi:hypothetical protein
VSISSHICGLYCTSLILCITLLCANKQQSLKDLLAELLRPRKAGLFETTVQFTEEGTTFSPTCTSIQDMLETMTEAIVHTANGVGRLLYMRPFNDILLLQQSTTQQQQQQHAAVTTGTTAAAANGTVTGSSNGNSNGATAAVSGVRDGPNIGLIVRAARDFIQAATNISEKVTAQQVIAIPLLCFLQSCCNVIKDICCSWSYHFFKATVLVIPHL